MILEFLKLGPQVSERPMISLENKPDPPQESDKFVHCPNGCETLTLNGAVPFLPIQELATGKAHRM